MHPSPPLRLALDQLYERFAVYSRPTDMDASPVHDRTEIQQLLITPPTVLSLDAIRGYAMSAMTTIGNVEDYKHFLPIITELAVASGITDPETIAHKLKYAGWQDWPPGEVGAVVAVFEAAFVQALDEHPDEYLADSWFQAMAMLGLDIGRLIELWQCTPSGNATLQLTYVMNPPSLFKAEPDSYWSDVPKEISEAVRAWLVSPEIRERLGAARSIVSPTHVWMLDVALDQQDEWIRRRTQ